MFVEHLRDTYPLRLFVEYRHTQDARGFLVDSAVETGVAIGIGDVFGAAARERRAGNAGIAGNSNLLGCDTFGHPRPQPPEARSWRNRVLRSALAPHRGYDGLP